MKIDRLKQLAGQDQLQEGVNLTAAREVVTKLLPQITNIAHEVKEVTKAAGRGNEFRREVARLFFDELAKQVSI